MAVLETGVLFGGIPLIRKSFIEIDNSDRRLTLGLLEAIQSFSAEIFDDETETFKMKKYSIFLKKQKLKSDQFVSIYAICESQTKAIIIREIIDAIAEAFYNNYKEVKSEMTAIYSDFEEYLTKKIGDLAYKPEDRLRKIFRD